MNRRTLAALALAALVGASTALPCTVFLIARDGRVLAGNNEDWTDPETKIWFIEEQDPTHHGRVYFGFGNWFPQGGMNTRGLFFDGLALTGREDAKPSDRPTFKGNLIDEAMKTCATIDEVVALFEQWDFGTGAAQLMFGDSAGQSVVIERGVMHRKQGEFQVSTNFRLSRQTPEEARCRRYAAASQKLAKAEAATVEAARDALEASHQSITLYSNVYDLVAGDVYLWLNHDFEQVVKFNLREQLEHGSARHALPEFFAAHAEQ